jgi:hypothetical protein
MFVEDLLVSAFLTMIFRFANRIWVRSLQPSIEEVYAIRDHKANRFEKPARKLIYALLDWHNAQKFARVRCKCPPVEPNKLLLQTCSLNRKVFTNKGSTSRPRLFDDPTGGELLADASAHTETPHCTDNRKPSHNRGDWKDGSGREHRESAITIRYYFMSDTDFTS